MPRLRSSDPPPKLPARYLERVARLHADLGNPAITPYTELSMEEIAALYDISLTDANKLMSDYQRVYPNTRYIRHVRYVRRARDRDA